MCTVQDRMNFFYAWFWYFSFPADSGEKRNERTDARLTSPRDGINEDDISIGDDDDDDDDDDIGMQTEVKPRSVIEGGTDPGWTPLSSVVLWRRMLGILGNINNVKDAEIHGSVFKHLIELWLMLETVKTILFIWLK